MEKVYRKIKEIRELKGYTQKEIADRLGLVPASYSKIENGKTALTIENLQKIADFLGVSAKQIMFDEKESVDEIALKQAEKEAMLYKKELKILYREITSTVTNIYFNTIWANLTPAEQKEATVNNRFNPVLGASIIRLRKDEQTSVEIFHSIIIQIMEGITKIMQDRISTDE